MSIGWWFRKKFFGTDPEEEIVHTEPLYEYEIEHLNGEVSESTGNAHQRDEGFIVIREKDNETWGLYTFDHSDMTGAPGFSGWRGYDVVDEFGEVKNLEKEQIGEEHIFLGYNRETGDWWLKGRKDEIFKRKTF